MSTKNSGDRRGAARSTRIPKRLKPFEMGGKYVIKNATVVSVDNSIGTIPNCDVLIEDGFIKAVGPDVEHSSEQVISDATNTIGCTAALGIDICSNCPADMFQQMRLLPQAQRCVDQAQAPGPPLNMPHKCVEVLIVILAKIWRGIKLILTFLLSVF